MKRYTVNATVTISIYTEVEAESEEEALELAEGREMCSLVPPSRMGSRSDEVWCHCGELDGTPQDLRVEEAR